MLPSIHQRYGDNLLIGGTATSTPGPMATYADATLLTQQPGDRVRWAFGTVVIHIHLAAPGRVDVIVIPCWNVIDQSEPVVIFESDAGMSVPVAVPTMMPSGIPRTTAADLTVLEPDAAKRTDDDFDLIVTGNVYNLIMGGAILLYGPKRTLPDSDWEWGLQRASRFYSIVHENDYGTDLVYPRRTRGRSVKASTLASVEDAETIELWADDNFGNGLPGFMWPCPNRFDGFFGRLDAIQTQESKPGDGVAISLTFTEISKGKPVV